MLVKIERERELGGRIHKVQTSGTGKIPAHLGKNEPNSVND